MARQETQVGSTLAKYAPLLLTATAVLLFFPWSRGERLLGAQINSQL